jgi:DNA-binding IscR family transcriptional regulator
MLASTKGCYALRVIVDLAEHSVSGYISPKDITDSQEVSENIWRTLSLF